MRLLQLLSKHVSIHKGLHQHTVAQNKRRRAMPHLACTNRLPCSAAHCRGFLPLREGDLHAQDASEPAERLACFQG